MAFPSRLEVELQLLESMYRDQTHYHRGNGKFKFDTSKGGSLHLQIPVRYPEDGPIFVISAHDDSKKDIKDKVKDEIELIDAAQQGEERLDAIIAYFLEVVDQVANADVQDDIHTAEAAKGHDSTLNNYSEPSKTVIVWLHHLLALGKRKLATSPPPTVRGITKPGYPGILVFTGPGSAVSDHVNTLKAENWQAFQVRYEGEELWELAGGVETVREVETMAELVKMLEAGEQGAKQKEEFLKAAGIK